MNRLASFAAPVIGLALAMGACSPADRPSAPPPSGDTAPAPPVAAPPGPPPPVSAPPAAPVTQDPAVLGLEGLGDLRIDQPLPTGGSWRERGAQTGDACRTVSSPDHPSVYAIVTEGRVRRITLGQRSAVRLAEGVGIGSTEADVLKWFAGFREEAHTYEAAPAKYLTAPNAASGGPALRFEIGADGTVKMIHVGIMPVLAYVEGCS